MPQHEAGNNPQITEVSINIDNERVSEATVPKTVDMSANTLPCLRVPSRREVCIDLAIVTLGSNVILGEGCLLFLASLPFLSTKLFSWSSLHCSSFAENQHCHHSSSICSNKSKGQRIRRTQNGKPFLRCSITTIFLRKYW